VFLSRWMAPAVLVCAAPACVPARGQVRTFGTASVDGFDAALSPCGVWSKMVAEAAAHLAEFGLEREGAPILVRLIVTIAERYSIPVSTKAAAQLVPAIGAAGGALINTLFIDHFQDIARGHFTVRRLEKTYGAARVTAQYRELLNGLKEARQKR